MNRKGSVPSGWFDTRDIWSLLVRVVEGGENIPELDNTRNNEDNHYEEDDDNN